MDNIENVTKILNDKIKENINLFKNNPLKNQSIKFFKELGYSSDRTIDMNSPLEFYDWVNSINPNKFIKEKALFEKWKSINVLFQITDDELSFNQTLFKDNDISHSNLKSYLFFAIDLDIAESETLPRGKLSDITRQINKVFAMPVLILFRYSNKLSIAIINRRENKRDKDKDVLEKVTLIKDISILSPHRGHLEILKDLSISEISTDYACSNFDELHSAWSKILDVNTLNKRFFKEISNWYFWALKHLQFPLQNDISKTELNPTSTIRMLTRIIFVWFIKEKGLIPEEIFNPKYLKENLFAHQLNWEITDESAYYKAILQNLFFATLNSEMGDKKRPRRFRSKNEKGLDGNFGIHNVYRYEKLFSDPKLALELFKNVPFLNGGLFECLDDTTKMYERKDGTRSYTRIDGFSDRADNQLKVPNYLFFDETKEVDLSEDYGKEKTAKKSKVRGLLNILSSYKFTIAENTPIEEEIALDPEILGKVFENLLASYNPETKTSARKDSGSFYTPRVVVDYMVDESIKLHLKKSLVNYGMPEEDAIEGLDILFAYTEKEHLFNNEEVSALIAAIDNLKILDPACGSGAYPMGILHKLVYILHKLDPENKKWRNRQEEKVESIEDTVSRENALQAIADTFTKYSDNNDYGRKLYLIENCIHGVDIQSIACQISKLRFFISLICEQKVDDKLENRGIRPLPNLETKFVCANTLIKLNKPEQLLLRNPEIDKKEKELEVVRDKHFGARNPETKKKYREKDEVLREEIAQLLLNDGWDDEVATQVSSWNPYDQNSSANFFDSEWMYGIKDGFDIVIGNPPYVQLQKFKGNPIQKIYKDLGFKVHNSNGDIYCLFYEKGMALLAKGGILTYITSNKWMRAGYGEELRDFFTNNENNPIVLIDLGPNVFENATVDTNILIIEKSPYEKNTMSCKLADRSINMSDYFRQNATPMEFDSSSWCILSEIEQSIKRKIEAVGTPLKDWDIKIYRGVLTGCNEAFIIDGAKRDKILANCQSEEERKKTAELIRPILRGKDIKKYKANFADKWLIASHNGTDTESRVDINNFPSVKKHLDEYWDKIQKRADKGDTPYNLRSCAYMDDFSKQVICWQRITQEPRFFMTNGDYVILDSMAFLSHIPKKYSNWLLAVLNSDLIYYWVKINVHEYGDTGFRLSNQYVEEIPIPILNNDSLKEINALTETYIHSGNNQIYKELQPNIFDIYKITLEERLFVENMLI